MGRVWKSFLLAWQFFTIIPAPSVKTITDKDMTRSSLSLPVIGAVLGLGLTGLSLVLRHILPAPAAMFIALMFYTFATGALHVDGLMDTADAIGSRQNRARALAIMKDSRVGAMGAIVAVFLLAGKWIAMSELPVSTVVVLWMVPMWSRLALLWAMVISPAAKEGGLGAQFAKRVHVPTVWFMSLLTFLASALLSSVALATGLLVSCVIVVGLFVPWMRRKFGGMTGDTYGSVVELSEWVMCFVLVALPSMFLRA